MWTWEGDDERSASGDRRGEGIVLTNLGYALNEGGDKRKALVRFDEFLAGLPAGIRRLAAR